ncbi:hypothetical protein MBCUT_00490 [Methanobrevibacter cuticularis]|uniref:DUF106 domain-containing protein n=1 Tax=Methanobrevibacter cuticularis TaxID=47311 RepID=A0A166FJZ8_9EURY|nr:EMC3/TMCO1 family protein [Methanobrevibacter cuticularis]KZX17754.1 hypothetical protein MBCUT_00490 [Methanobrevibacter cuticularis]
MDIFTIIFGGLDMIFGPVLALDPNPSNPMLTIFLISTLIAFITTLANKLLVNQDEMESIRNEMKEFQTEMKEAQLSGDSKALAKAQAQQKEVMAKQTKMMTSSFKPVIITFIPIILVYWWMGQSAVSKVAVQLPEFVYYILLVPLWHMFYGGNSAPFIVGWLGWYILCTFAMSQILRKYMGLKSGM